MAEDAVDEFERHRSLVFRVAYRMLGSADEAEDVLQDTFVRWHGAQASTIRTPSAWLVTVATNLSLNRLTSARARREHYPGPWLPEPVLTADGTLGPLETAEQRDMVSLAFLVLLDRLTPAERAVFVLREAFDYSHRDVAHVLELSESNSRQLHRRARHKLSRAPGTGGGRPEVPDRTRHRDLVGRFLTAAQEGDLAGLERLLSEDVVSWADGGGKVGTARRPVVGAARVTRYLIGALTKFGGDATPVVSEVNGEPAVLGLQGSSVLGVLVPEVTDNVITVIRIIANPDKLSFVSAQVAGLSHPAGPPGS